MWGWLISLATGPLGPVLIKIVEVIGILMVLFGLYKAIQHSAAQNQHLKDQLVIEQQILKNQKDFQQKNDAIIKQQQDSSAALESAVSKILQNNEKIDTILADPKVIGAAKPASPVLKEVVKQLKRND